MSPTTVIATNPTTVTTLDEGVLSIPEGYSWTIAESGDLTVVDTQGAIVGHYPTGDWSYLTEKVPGLTAA